MRNEHLYQHRAFGWAAGINLAFVGVEALAGWFGHSTALWADAAHNLSDVAGLGLAWAAAMLARSPRTPRRTYGLRKATVLAAVANSLLLLLAVAGVCREAIHHLGEPSSPNGPVVVAVALIGVLINGASAALFAKDRKHDVNARGVFLHLVADATVSLIVVVSGILVIWTQSPWVDPVAGIAVSGAVLLGAWRLLRESVDLALDAVPPGVDPVAVKTLLESLPGVCGVHDLHIWALGTDEIALTAHLEMQWPAASPAFLPGVADTLRETFGIGHVTLQLDDDPKDRSHACAQGRDA